METALARALPPARPPRHLSLNGAHPRRPTSTAASVRHRLGGSPAGEETRSRRPAGARRHGASRAVAGERLISRCEAHALGHGTRGDEFDAGEQQGEHVVVGAERQRIEVFRREGSTWVLSIYEAGATVKLDSLSLEFPVSEIYALPSATPA